MKCLLCALTGMGNLVLEGLIESQYVGEILVISREESGDFPYYDCENLKRACKSKGVVCHTGVDMKSDHACELVKRFDPDLFMTATFDQIIPEKIFKLAIKNAVNVHPSLLPKYRGPSPTGWAIINGEKTSGVTIHELSSEIDAGDIFLQLEMPISRLTDGELRLSLNKLAKKAVLKFISLLVSGKLKRTAQPSSQNNVHPKVNSPEALMMLASGSFQQDRVRRALTPYPGEDVIKEYYGL